jgi:hypothetical protein
MATAWGIFVQLTHLRWLRFRMQQQDKPFGNFSGQGQGQGTEVRDQGTVDREQRTENRDQGSGDRGTREQGSGNREWG